MNFAQILHILKINFIQNRTPFQANKKNEKKNHQQLEKNKNNDEMNKIKTKDGMT